MQLFSWCQLTACGDHAAKQRRRTSYMRATGALLGLRRAQRGAVMPGAGALDLVSRVLHRSRALARRVGTQEASCVLYARVWSAGWGQIALGACREEKNHYPHGHRLHARCRVAAGPREPSSRSHVCAMSRFRGAAEPRGTFWRNFWRNFDPNTRAHIHTHSSPGAPACSRSPEPE
jgi:hypothetical protein